MSTVSNNSQCMLGMQELVELARFLRQNGDKILSESSKFSLSTTLLSNLNEAFSLIVDETEDFDCSFQVCNSSKIDIFRDIKFLYDFVQKTVGLKVTHNPNDVKISIDITKFRHLKYLELQKVCIESVRGLQAVRGQLESVTCSGGRGVGSAGRLLAACGGDAGIGFVWGSLQHLALPYNALARLDKSLELAPWLQTLDLSHNLISSAAELDCLPNLKNLNLGYNKLEAIPIFNKATFHTLQILVLKNNYIENLNGLQGLECLTELDLSYNCLMEHSVLWPLEVMSALLWVSLEGNPLSYHPRHRLLCIKHLHPNLTNSKFVLDHLQLSKSEKQLVEENRPLAIRSTRSASRDDLTSLSSSIIVDATSIESSTFDESMSRSQSFEFTESMETSIMRSRKKLNVKEAIIAEDDHERDQSKLISSVVLNSNIESSTDHLEIKKQILALREKYGENNWLSSHAGTFVQDIMGLQRTPGPVLTFTSAITTPTNTPVNTSTYASPVQLSDVLNFLSKPHVEDITNEKHDNDVNDETTEKNMEENSDEREYDGNTLVNETLEETITELSDSVYDSMEEKGDLYLVRKKKDRNEMEELFLVITSEDIKERDSITGKVKYRWATNTVLSCVKGGGEESTVDFIFDTTRKDWRQRTYFVESDDAKRIVTSLDEMMSARPIALDVFKCMKCSTHFSRDADCSTMIISVNTSGVRTPKCPTCESTLVIQTDELSTPDIESTKITEGKVKSDLRKGQSSEIPVEMNLQHSESHSSIGSATSLDDSRESTPSASTMTKKYESDIEILSNPSQSSIEVLDDGSKTSVTPNRKRSSEERRIANAPSLLTIPDRALVMAGLTESSSSGSLTDSICTTYENKIIKHLETNGKTHGRASIETETIETAMVEKEATFVPVTNLTSMLGGLLQSMKIGTNKYSPSKTEEESTFLGSCIQYSYTDFNNVDHRLKLHIILNVFEHENEELVLLVRGEILMQALTEAFPGCLVLSTSKVYILRITGAEGEDPQRWLHKETSWTMDRLRTFAPLPFKQGVSIELQQPNKLGEEPSNAIILCILQDFQRTSNFLFYLTDLPLPDNCEVEFSIPQHCSSLMHDLVMSSKSHRDDDAIRLLAIFSHATLKFEDRNVKLKVSGLIVTTSTLIVMKDKMHWLVSGSNEAPAIMTEQAMSNLIEVEQDGTSLTLNFLDEVAGTEEIWTLKFVSTDAVDAVINSIQSPWEELFSVPLQISIKTLDNLKT